MLKKKIIAFVLIILLKPIATIKSEVFFFNETSDFIVATEIDSLKVNSYKQLNKIYNDKNYTVALKEGYNLLEKYLNDGDNRSYAITSNIVANILYETNDHKNSIKYFKRSLKFFEETSQKYLDLKTDESFNLENQIFLSKNLQKIGSAYHFLRVNDSINRKKYSDSTNYYYEKVSQLQSNVKEILKIKAIVYNNIATMHIGNKEFEEAEESINLAINIYKKINDVVGEAGSLGNLASIHLINNEYSEAKDIYLKALNLINNNNSAKAVTSKGSLYANLAWAMYNLKDYKAYEYQEFSYEIKDELRNNEFRGIVKKINAEYNFDAQKKLLLKEEENKRLKAQTTFWIYGIGSFIVILTLLYGLNFYKLKQRNLGLKLSQTELIQNQNIEKIKSEAQVRILNATIDGKETERKQIAETLHDSVSALLSSANLHLQASRTQFNGGTPLEIDKTQQIITEASQKIRDLSHTLVSSVLLKFGLNYAIKDLAEKYSNSQIKMHTEIKGLRRYHQSFEIKAYNIIQEFLNNILKHSKAKNANIFIEEKNKNLFIEIKDDGVGFDKTKITEKDGLGINQIDARIHVMEGEFYIVSEIGKGTNIMVELPILEKEAIIYE